jgi:hypothetical protein
VFRIAHRLDLASGKTPLEVEMGLLEVIRGVSAAQPPLAHPAAATSVRRANPSRVCVVCRAVRSGESGSIAAREGRRATKGFVMTVANGANS